VVDPHHPLYGNSFPVSDRRSGRGFAVIVVRLPDGRERGILRSATDAAASPGEWPAEYLRAFITARTLLPLANHVRSVLASRDGDHEGGRRADQTFATQEGAGAGLPDGKAAPTVVGAAGRSEAGVGTAGGSTPATTVGDARPVGEGA
jgi:hypothetical protein